MTRIIKTVSRFGARGGHICLPKRLIGKKVTVIVDEEIPLKEREMSYDKPEMSYDKPNSLSRSPQTPGKVSYDNIEEPDEEEEDFLDRYNSAKSSYDQETIKAHAIRSFGKDRVSCLLRLNK